MTESLLAPLRIKARVAQGREPEPSAGVLGSDALRWPHPDGLKRHQLASEGAGRGKAGLGDQRVQQCGCHRFTRHQHTEMDRPDHLLDE